MSLIRMGKGGNVAWKMSLIRMGKGGNVAWKMSLIRKEKQGNDARNISPKGKEQSWNVAWVMPLIRKKKTGECCKEYLFASKRKKEEMLHGILYCNSYKQLSSCDSGNKN